MRNVSSQRFDATTGLYYVESADGARYYDPTIARFISPDTIVPGIADPQAWNCYAYMLGNPEEKTAPHVFTVHPN